MKKYSIISSFESLPIEIFWYPSVKTKHTIIILKGIYGLHDPKSKKSWEIELIKELNPLYNILCINTARKQKNGQDSDKELFINKTFKQECDDVWKVYDYLINKKIISKKQKISIIGNSFGGTTLLGIPKLIKLASSIIMIGSGCGKKPGTTKPLLSTLPEEETLLKAMNSFTGNFSFIRGKNDTVVPEESQNKIIENANSAKINLLLNINKANHDLSPENNKIKISRTKIISNTLKMISDSI
jgi:hypothetical protein